MRVTAVSKSVFRVFSILFSGEIRADSHKEAARIACNELDILDRNVSKSSAARSSGCQ